MHLGTGGSSTDGDEMLDHPGNHGNLALFVGDNWDITRHWSVAMEYNDFFGSREAYIASVTWRF